MSKKILIMSLGVIFVLLCCYICMTVVFVVANADVPPEPIEYTMTQVYNGQSLTSEDIITINSAEELRQFASYVNDNETAVNRRTFKLMTDIELNEGNNDWINWEYEPPENVWTPIGTPTAKFRGYFYGQGHTISGVYIDSTDDYQGLFGYNDGFILDVGSINFNITGGSMVGGLVGYNEETIIDSYADKGLVISDSTGILDSFGGLTGTNASDGIMMNCYNLSTVIGSGVTGDYYIGGIAGLNYGSLLNCYNAGSVVGAANYKGSVLGNYADLMGGNVSNCYWLVGSGGQINQGTAVDKFDSDGIFQTDNNDSVNNVSITAGETDLRDALNSYVDYYYVDFYEEGLPTLKRWVGGPFPTLAGIRTILFSEYSGTFDPAYTIPTNYLEGTSVDLPTSAEITKTGYTFNGWTLQESEWDENTNPYVTSITINETGNKIFYAKWTINKYTVTWKNGDSVIATDEDVEFGTTPTFTGDTPTKDADGGYTYSFSGWSPEIGSVQGDITYNAQFTATPIIDSTIEPEAEQNLLWLWIVISVLGALLIVLLVLWLFLYKRKIKFILDGKIVGEAKYKLNEQIIIPEDLAIYSWFIDEKETLLFAKQKMGLFGFKVYGDSGKEQKSVKVE